MQSRKKCPNILVFPVLVIQGVFVYWVTSNAFTIVQSMTLKNVQVRDYFNIPRLVKHQPVDTVGLAKPMGFMEGFRAAMDANKKQSESSSSPMKF
jgi:YidC/Oxa1 family membrane protein insertase